MKTAVITGANRGLGLAIVKRFASNGYNVIACVRKISEELEIVFSQLSQQYGVGITMMGFDCANPDAVKKACEKLASCDDKIDVLVNNAGISIKKPLLYVTYEELLQSFQVNYFAAVQLTKAVMSKMIHEEGGSIINITTSLSLGKQPCGTCYEASKAALNQFTVSVAQELAPLGVRVNAIACGPMKTDMFDALTDKEQKKLIAPISVRRPAETEEIVNMIEWLVSDKASYVIGQVICVDGGAAY